MSGIVPTSEVPIELSLLLVSAVVAGVFFAIGARLARRPVSDHSRLASFQFSLFWVGIGSIVAINAVLVAQALANAAPFALVISIYLVSLLVDCVFLWALVSALTYVYTGSYHLFELGAFYFAFYVVLLYWALSQNPQGVVLLAGIPSLSFATSASPAITAAVTLGLIVPGIAAAIVYLSLLRETRDPSLRFRIELVSTSILLWFALEIVVPSATAPWLLARSALEVIPGVLSLIALLPPEWIRRRLHVRAPEGKEEYYRRQRAQR